MPRLDTELMDARKTKFLEAYATTGVIQTGCDACGMSRTTYKNWRKADVDFDAACDDAYQIAVDAGELELRTRAIDGHEEVMTYKGEPIWRRNPSDGKLILDDDFNPMPFTVFKKSDKLLEIYVKAHRPQYKDKSAVEVTGPGGGALETKITIEFVDPPKREEGGDADAGGADATAT